MEKGKTGLTGSVVSRGKEEQATRPKRVNCLALRSGKVRLNGSSQRLKRRGKRKRKRAHQLVGRRAELKKEKEKAARL